MTALLFLLLKCDGYEFSQSYHDFISIAVMQLIIIIINNELQLIPRSQSALPPYPHQTAWPPQASSSIHPTLKR